MLNRKALKLKRPTAWAFIPLYLVLAAAILALFHSYTETDLTKLYLTPSLHDGNGWDIYALDESGGRIPLTPPQTPGRAGAVYLSRVLDAAYEEAGYTTLELDGPVSVFLDGELLYTTAPGSGDRAETAELPEGYQVPSAGETPRLTLPPGYGGKTLTLAFNRGANIKGLPMVILSSRAVDTALDVTYANQIGMPAAAYMTAVFLLLGLLFYGGFQGRWDWSMLLLTLAAFFQALYQLRDFSLMLIFPAALDTRAAVLIPPLFVALPLGYLLCRMERRRKQRTALVLLPVAVALAPGICELFDWPYLDGRHALCTQALYVSIAAALICAALEARAGSRTFRLFLAGLGAFIGALAAACLFSPSLANYVGKVFLLLIEGVPFTPLYWCGAILFVLCTVLSVGNAIRTTAEGWSRTELLSAQVSALEGRVAATQAVEEAIRIERHDLRHRLQIVAGMVERDEKAEALDFLGAAQTRLEELKPARWCQNPVLDAMFASYFEQAARQHIQVEASLAIPDELAVDAAELATVFANALENAIHACAQLPEAERKIVCKCRNRPGLMFEVANTYAGEVRFYGDGLPASSRRGHGVGTRSIAAFCEKHGAVCSYEAKDGWFRMRVIL